MISIILNSTCSGQCMMKLHLLQPERNSHCTDSTCSGLWITPTMLYGFWMIPTILSSTCCRLLPLYWTAPSMVCERLPLYCNSVLLFTAGEWLLLHMLNSTLHCPPDDFHYIELHLLQLMNFSHVTELRLLPSVNDAYSTELHLLQATDDSHYTELHLLGLIQ